MKGAAIDLAGKQRGAMQAFFAKARRFKTEVKRVAEIP
jgi:hypothetical protein